MTIESTLYSVLVADADVIALVGNGDSPVTGRIYPQEAPEDITKPYVVYSVITSTNPQTFSGLSTLENARVQVDVYADTYGGSRVLMGHVKDAIDENMAVGEVFWNSVFEQNTDIHRQSMDFSLWA